MNPMMDALQQSRASNPAPTGQTPVPGTPGAPGQDMAKYWEMIQEMSAKLDKVLEALSMKNQGKGPKEDSENDGNEAKGAY